ncbi:rac GTPase-activating protein 1-like isoform X2 [Planococcus citri]|uniref:rac GTPase-activating protein 1-like isoform X2 n=1 Tax=Planococcus citri TaxID=170843 RepID=UPI0031F7CFE3
MYVEFSLSTEAMNVKNVVFEFDKLMKAYQVAIENPCEETFLRYVLNQEQQHLKFIETVNENKRLKAALDTAEKDIAITNGKLVSAKKIIDGERNRRLQIESEKECFAERFSSLRQVLLNDLANLPISVKNHLAMLDDEPKSKSNNYLSTIMEADSTANTTSTTRSEEELDDSVIHYQQYKKHRVSDEDQPVAIKKRRSSVRSDPINVDSKSNANLSKLNSRNHTFVGRNVIMPERCVLCEKRLRFGQNAFRCSECNATIHAECRSKLPLPCVPMGVPAKKGTRVTLEDFTPPSFPRIPALVIHCVNKIEQLGLKEIGLYRVPGNDREIRALKEKFLRCKGVPSLEDVDIHTICCCLKDFLRNLDDPLIPHEERENFALEVADRNSEKLKTLVQSLPQANRHTLAYLILHLQRVASTIASKMPIYNLATVFGPTIVGFSDIEPMNPFVEAQVSISIVTELLELPSEFWNSLLEEDAATLKSDRKNSKNCPFKESPSLKKLPNSKNKRFFNSPTTRY